MVFYYQNGFGGGVEVDLPLIHLWGGKGGSGRGEKGVKKVMFYII